MEKNIIVAETAEQREENHTMKVLELFRIYKELPPKQQEELFNLVVKVERD